MYTLNSQQQQQQQRQQHVMTFIYVLTGDLYLEINIPSHIIIWYREAFCKYLIICRSCAELRRYQRNEVCTQW